MSKPDSQHDPHLVAMRKVEERLDRELKAAIVKLHGDIKQNSPLLIDEEGAKILLRSQKLIANWQGSLAGIDALETWWRMYRRDLGERLPEVRPPGLALKLLAYLSPTKEREAILGDAEERFRTDHARFGVLHARRLLWWDAIRSVAALALRTMIKPALAVLAYFGLFRISK